MVLLACLGAALLLLLVVCLFATPSVDPALLKAWMDEIDKS